MSDPSKKLNEELQKARNQIEQAHQEWMAALDAVDDPIFLHDKKYRILRANRAYQRRAGIPFKEIIGRPYYEIFPKMDGPLPGCQHSIEKIIVEGSDEEIVLDGTVYRSRAFPVYDEQGKYLCSVHSFEDVTERMEMEASLKSTNALLHSVVENAPVRIFWKDAELRYIGCNATFAHDAGFSKPEELIGKDDYQMGWSEQADLYRADDRGVMDSGTPKIGYEEPQTTPDGRPIWLRTSKVPLRDEHGKIFGMLGMYEDITERKRAEEQIRISQITYEGIINSITETIYIQDEKGVFLNVSLAVEKMYGYPREYFVGRTPEFISAPGKNDLVEIAKYTHQAFNGQLQEFEFWGLRKDGTVFPKEISLVPGTYFGKKVVIAVARDITERKNAEEALRRANRALKLLSKCNMVLVHAEQEQEFLPEICRLTVETGGYLMAWVGFAENDIAKTVTPVAQSGYEEGYLDGVNVTWADTEWGQGPTGTAIRTGVTVINQDCLTNPKMAPWLESAIKRGYQSSIALPLICKKHVLGALTIYAADSGSFGKEEVALLEELANDLAYGIETLRTRAEHEQHATILRQSLEQSIQTIADTVEARDPYTAGHQRRVAELAAAIAREMDLPEEQVTGIHLAAIIHDLGKIHIPAEILSKPSRLNAIEYMLIKTHPQDGYDILKNVKFPWPIADIVLQHHERLDGSGYPQGLKGDAILFEARLLCVADVVEAMSSHRPYRPGLGIEAAIDEIMRGRGTHYDSQVVDACVALFREKKYVIPN